MPLPASHPADPGTNPGQIGEINGALEYYEQVLLITPLDVVALNRKAVALINLGRFEEALASCEKASAIDDRGSDIWITMGVAYDNLGRYSEAAAALEHAVRISPYDAYANALLSIIYQKLDMRSAAEVQNRRLQVIIFPREYTGYYFTLASFLLGVLAGGVLKTEGKPLFVTGGAAFLIFLFFCAICILSWRSLWISHEISRPPAAHTISCPKRGYGTASMYIIIGVMIAGFILGTGTGIALSGFLR